MTLSPQNRWLLERFRRHRQYLVLSLLLTFGSVGLFMLMPRWTAWLVQHLPEGRIEPIFWHLVLGLCIYLGGLILGLARTYATAIFLHTLATETRLKLFDHILHISPRSMNFSSHGDVLSRVSNDIALLQGSLASIVSDLFPSIVLAACFSFAMAYYSFTLFVLIAIVLSPLVIVSSVFGGYLYEASHACQVSLARLISRFDELLGGAREIKAFGEEPRLLRRFESLSAENLTVHLRRDRLDALHPLAISVVVAIATVIVLLASLYLLESAWITSENLTSFFVCLLLAYSPLQRASFASSRLQQFRAVMERLDAILSIETEHDGDVELAKGVARGEITFERVGFSYPRGNFKIDKLSFEIPAGQMVALVGPSGAGKSTTLDFISRFLVPQSGRVLLDGSDIRQFRLRDLRQEIGIVSQEPVLFEGTLEENLRFGCEDASREDIRRAAAAANVEEFALQMPQGYDTRIDFRGGNLSVGQRQRIALARVLVRGSRILLFDEPTSALDAVSEDLVRTAMKKVSAGRTTFVVAHRLSTIRDADRILVLSEGRIVEDGSHSSLVRAGGLYQRLFEAQSDSVDAKLARAVAGS